MSVFKIMPIRIPQDAGIFILVSSYLSSACSPDASHSTLCSLATQLPCRPSLHALLQDSIEKEKILAKYMLLGTERAFAKTFVAVREWVIAEILKDVCQRGF